MIASRWWPHDAACVCAGGVERSDNPARDLACIDSGSEALLLEIGGALCVRTLHADEHT